MEKLRWNGKPVCPHCKGSSVTKRKKSIRYHCNACNRDFSVLYGTIFEDTRLTLPEWFRLILLMVNAKQGISAAQIQRTLGIGYATAWYASMRVRCAMANYEKQLKGIVEMDESYVGGKSRKRNNQAVLHKITVKRGRGTKKVPIVGIVERGKTGNVRVRILEKLSGRNLLAMLKRNVDVDNAILVTDKFRGYSQMKKTVEHLTVEHQKQFSKGIVHINTIEGFWSIVKRGIKGQYIVVSKKYLPFYLAEFSYKYNQRHKQKNAFENMIRSALMDEKCFIYYKPKRNPKKITYV